MKLLLAAATTFEIQGFTTYLSENWETITPEKLYRKGNDELHICITGVGIMAATYWLTKALLQDRYDLAIQAGIGGSFDTSIQLGEVVCVATEQLGDLGAEDHDQFLDIFSMGFVAKDGFPYFDGKLRCNFDQLPIDVSPLRKVDSITVNTVSGNEQTITRRQKMYLPTVESMEGASFHFACLQENVPFLQIRSMSNYVEPRDRSRWKIKEAIIALNHWLVTNIASAELKA